MHNKLNIIISIFNQLCKQHFSAIVMMRQLISIMFLHFLVLPGVIPRLYLWKMYLVSKYRDGQTGQITEKCYSRH